MSAGGIWNASRPDLNDICTMKMAGNRTRRTSRAVASIVDARAELLNLHLPPGHAERDQAHEHRDREHYHDDRARVAHVGVGEPLEVGIEVGHLGRRPRSAP